MGHFSTEMMINDNDTDNEWATQKFEKNVINLCYFMFNVVIKCNHGH